VLAGDANQNPALEASSFHRNPEAQRDLNRRPGPPGSRVFRASQIKGERSEWSGVEVDGKKQKEAESEESLAEKGAYGGAVSSPFHPMAASGTG
jgi:hypothetical protein